MGYFTNIIPGDETPNALDNLRVIDITLLDLLAAAQPSVYEHGPMLITVSATADAAQWDVCIGAHPFTHKFPHQAATYLHTSGYEHERSELLLEAVGDLVDLLADAIDVQAP